MRKVLFISSILLLSLFACNDNNFQVNIEMDNANGKTIYLQRIVDGKTLNIDSVAINGKNAVFNVKKNDNLDAYHVFIKGWRRALPFFADNQNVSIKGDFNKYHQIAINTESQTQAALDEFTKKYYEFDAQLDKANDAVSKAKESGDAEAIEKAQTAYDEIEANQHYFIFETVWDNPSDVLSPYILYRYKWAFELCELREATSNLSPELNSAYLHMIKDYIKLLERTEVGKKYMDFTLKNIDNQDFTLSSLIGKTEIVMLDFWASWCPDCRVENPNIVAVYNDFHDKGLEIVSVSLDTDKTAWLKGIEDDALAWENHVSDLKGWNCAVAKEYGIAFIPQNILIDANGTIIAKNLNGESLRTFVEETLNN